MSGLDLSQKAQNTEEVGADSDLMEEVGMTSVNMEEDTMTDTFMDIDERGGTGRGTGRARGATGAGGGNASASTPLSLKQFAELMEKGPLKHEDAFPELQIPRATRQQIPHRSIVTENSSGLKLNIIIKFTNEFKKPTPELLSKLNETADLFRQTLRVAGNVPRVVEEGIERWTTANQTVTMNIIEALERKEDRLPAEADIDFATFETAVDTFTTNLHAVCMDTIRLRQCNNRRSGKQRKAKKGVWEVVDVSDLDRDIQLQGN
eukprot:GHVU01085413.1.p1 GENE.GHVU01085413.1~~GHVU01085413.1.p1  ORF type:complete len:263 (+),score=59.70 GHVU01085413.1:591-1379(+)